MPYAFKAIPLVLLSSVALGNEGNYDIAITPNSDKVETVFDWSKDRCNDDNIPDSPARAFRSVDGRVNLYATHYTNIPLIGNSLGTVRPSCSIRLQAKMNPDPALYDARIWLQSFYSSDNGQNIYSLGSSDYHGRWFKNCDESNGKNLGCWWSAVVLAHSSDGGKTFNIALPPKHIVAKSRYSFSSQEGGPIGFLTTSNIVKIGEYYYSIFNVAGYKDQEQGNCIARTRDLEGATSWKFWDGAKYSQSFASDDEHLDKTDHCKTLANLPFKVRSLLWHPESKSYIAVFEEFVNRNGNPPRVDARFSYSWSEDLINWHDKKELLTIKGKDNCQPQSPAAYPSILDASSEDENFGTLGHEAFLYYTRFNLNEDCRLTLNRDLVRVPVTIHIMGASKPN